MQQGPQQVYRLSSLCLCKTSQVNSRGDETSSSTSFESHYLGTIPMIPLPSFQITLIYNSSKSSITFVIQLSSPAVQHVILSTRGEHDFWRHGFKTTYKNDRRKNIIYKDNLLVSTLIMSAADRNCHFRNKEQADWTLTSEIYIYSLTNLIIRNHPFSLLK